MNAEPTSDLPGIDQRFLADFEACRIDAARFGHREHLRVAYIYLSLHPFDDALDRMESGLLRLLAHLGAPPSKYHRRQCVRVRFTGAVYSRTRKFAQAKSSR
ncbi:MAG: hypothetical protein ACR2NX_07075 [Chthoniobacterales bacterium]